MAQNDEDSIFDPFEPEDYWPFVAGIVVLAGFVAIPLLWGYMSKIEYARSIIPSLLSCVAFIFAYDKRGKFSILKLALGTLFVFVLMIKVVASSGSHRPPPAFFASGIGAYIVTLVCGRIGIKIARLWRRKS